MDQLNIRLLVSDCEKLRLHANDSGVSLSSYIVSVLRTYLETESGKRDE